jgi:glycosyltransferase involved in cell wall biosynthesis
VPLPALFEDRETNDADYASVPQLGRRTMPKVSVVIPTFNRAVMLERALRSAVEQSLQDIEIIVSDNASTDATAEVLASFDDPRIVHDRMERNIGLHGNLTRSLWLGTAPYLAFLHDDDVFYPRNVELKAAFFDANPSVGAVYSPIDVVDGQGRTIAHDVSYGGRVEPGIERGPDYLRRIAPRMGLNDFTATMVRRRDIQGECFTVDDGNSCDLGFWMRLALHSDFGFIDEVLSCRLLHEDSQSTSSGSEALNEDGSSGTTVEYVTTMLRAKRRFAELYGSQLEDPDQWRRIAERAGRRQLAAAVKRGNRYEPGLLPSLVRLAAASRAHPGVLLEPRVARSTASATVAAKRRG